jgi:hypothetical protein
MNSLLTLGIHVVYRNYLLFFLYKPRSADFSSNRDQILPSINMDTLYKDYIPLLMHFKTIFIFIKPIKVRGKVTLVTLVRE